MPPIELTGPRNSIVVNFATSGVANVGFAILMAVAPVLSGGASSAAGAINASLVVSGLGASIASASGSISAALTVAGDTGGTVPAVGAISAALSVSGIGDAISAATGDASASLAVSGIGNSTASSSGAIAVTLVMEGNAGAAEAAGSIAAGLTVSGVGASTSASVGSIAAGLSVSGVGGGGGGFNPASLFGPGVAGAWYDPSDLSTLFQDAAGTTPVTAAGQPVGRMLDKSGNANHATQATAAARPTYQTGAGLHWLVFDGIDDIMSGGSVVISADYYMIAGAMVTAGGGIGVPFWATSVGQTGQDSLGIYTRTDVVRDAVAAIRVATGSSFIVNRRNDYALNAGFLAEAYHEAGNLTARVNGGTVSSIAAAVAGTGGTVPLNIGSASLPATRFFGGIFVKAVVGDALKTQARVFLAAKSGVTL